MLNVSRGSCVRSVLLCLIVAVAGFTAEAQTTESSTLSRQLSRLDLGILGSGFLNSDSSGTAIADGQSTLVRLHPSSTVAPLITIRYTKSPLVGIEFNYSYARYTNTFTPCGALTTPPSVCGIQQNRSGYTFGYVAHTRKQYYGVTPFAAVGAGTYEFSPTAQGGLSYLPQARATYYYSIGAETTVLSPHFGLRAQFRQSFFKAPDFETNYLTIQQRTSSIEPAIGIFLHF